MNLLAFDVENCLDKMNSSSIHTIRKLFFYFNKSSIEGKYAKPFSLKFFLDDSDQTWTLQDIYSNLSFIPLFLITTNSISSDFNYIDIFNKIYPIKKSESINKLKPLDDSAYDFEVNFGSKLVPHDVIDSLCELIETYEIEYSINDQFITLYPEDAKYNVQIALNGKINKENKYEITPHIKVYDGKQTLGKFDMFNGKSTPIPNDDNLAIIHTCKKCHKNFLVNWWTKSTPCPYCSTPNYETL